MAIHPMRPVTQEVLDKQVALMTAAMFDAVEKGDKALFELAIKKGADAAQLSNKGQPLLHVAMRKAVENGTVEWLNIVLPHVENLFVGNKKGLDVFDDANNDNLMPHRHPEYEARLTKMRRHLMTELPDIDAARAELEKTARQGLPAGGKILAPQFEVVGPRKIDKPVIPPEGAPAAQGGTVAARKNDGMS